MFNYFSERAIARRRNEGAAAVEFALILIPLITLVFGMMQYGWYFYTAQSASSAGREATRRLVVGDCQDPAALKAWAGSRANVNGFDLTVAPNPLPDIGEMVTVTVTANGMIIGFLPMPNDGQVTREVTARVEDKTEGPSCT